MEIRYNTLKAELRKTHLCGYHFRQRCLRIAENCDHAHGFWDMKRDLKSAELLALKMELFNIRQILNRNSQSVLFNPKSKRYEIYKNKDLSILRAIMRGETVQIAGGNVDDDDEEEDADENPATNN